MKSAAEVLGTSRHASRENIPRAGFWRLCSFSLAGLCLVWLPIAVLQQIDAILNFATPFEAASDVALLAMLLLVGSLLLAAIAATAGAVSAFAGASEAWADTLAWAVAGLPVVSLCAWQFAFAAKLWLEQVFDVRLTTAHLPYRGLWTWAPVVVIALWWLSVGKARLIRGISDPMLRLRTPALATALTAVIFVAGARPPLIVGAAQAGPERPHAAAGAPDIFVISLDSLAAADAGLCETDGPASMPRLRELASRSTCFTRHYAASNITFPSTATIETGTLPWTHWVVHGGKAPPEVTQAGIGARLRDVGYSTHAVVAAQGASPRQHGTYRGYDSVEMASSFSYHMTLINALQAFPESRSLSALLSGVLRLLYLVDLARLGETNPFPAENVFEPAARLFGGGRSEGRPLFMWLHSWPPHSPYLPPPSTRHRLLPAGQLERFRDFLADVGAYPPSRQAAVDRQRLRYRETIMGADESLGRFLDALERAGRLDDAVIIVTADHGESFEQGLLGHGGDALHEPVVRIPLLVKLPRQRVGRVVTEPTSQADIAPTVVELAGGAAQAWSEGRSLVEGLNSGVLPSMPVFSMAIPGEGRFREIRGGHYVVVDGRFKLTCHRVARRCELHDVVVDPQEQRDLAATDPATTTRLQALLDKRIAAAEARRREWFGKR